MDAAIVSKILRQVTNGTPAVDSLKMEIRPSGPLHTVVFTRTFGDDDRFNSFSFHLNDDDMLNFEQAITDYIEKVMVCKTEN